MHRIASSLALLPALCLAQGATAQRATDREGPAPSPFVQCDGYTGHVSTGETILRLLAITATAGLSEAAMRRDDPEGRLSGLAGAEACERAIAASGDEVRRARLGFARTIHYIEAERFDDAIRSANDYPAHIGALGAEWATVRTFGSVAARFQADALMRAGRMEEAEDAAVRAAEASDLEIVGLQRTLRYLFLTPRMTEGKRRVFATVRRRIPEMASSVADAYAWAGDYPAAAETVGMFVENMHAALPADSPGVFNFLATQAIYTALAGDLPRARGLVAEARTALAAGMTEGIASTEVRASTEERAALAEIIIQFSEGQRDEARRAFAGRGSWLLSPASATAALMTRLQADLPPAERTGALARDPASLRDEEFANRANILRNAERTKQLYDWTIFFATGDDYRRQAGRVWRVAERPAFLVRSPQRLPGFTPGSRYEVLHNANTATGSAADNESLLLHAALIARARGVSGFATVSQPQRYTTELLVRFGNVGEPGFPSGATFAADDVIGALAPYIPDPATRARR